MRKRIILLPIIWYENNYYLDDYNSFCKFLYDKSIQREEDEKSKNNEELCFSVVFTERGGTLYPNQKRYYSQNNSMMPLVELEYDADRKVLKIAAKSYLSLFFNIFTLNFVAISIWTHTWQCGFLSIMFLIVSQLAFWLPLKKIMRDIICIIDSANSSNSKSVDTEMRYLDT